MLIVTTDCPLTVLSEQFTKEALNFNRVAENPLCYTHHVGGGC